MPGLRRAQRKRRAGVGREAGIDPVCHTLVGAGLARSGLGSRTALGTATLLIGANLPDIDVLAYLGGPAADLELRRGWTHGVPALVVLPFLLTGGMLLFDRTVRRAGRASLPSRVVPRQLLVLAAVAIVSHPLLDTLNTYGVRWLMPFSGRWFYGDTLFIVDPWVWLALAGGLLLRSARGGLLLALGYVLVLAISGVAARILATGELTRLSGEPVRSLMVSPVLANPFVRTVVAAQNGSYRVAIFRWLERPHLDPRSVQVFPRDRPDHPAVEAAAATTLARRFLGWARFPVFQIEPGSGTAGSYHVHLVDLRYANRPGVTFGSVTIPVVIQPASGPRRGTPPASSPGVAGARLP
ncbi:MAG: metal-dependent hydrolase [Gemmatimonadales bacterium]|nr:metal-dependent hydrolase [Gemmatimonadales bacterium]